MGVAIALFLGGTIGWMSGVLCYATRAGTVADVVIGLASAGTFVVCLRTNTLFDSVLAGGLGATLTATALQFLRHLLGS